MAPVAFTRPFPGHHARSRVPGPPLPRCCHPNLGSLLRTSMMEGCDRGLWPACVPGSSICGELSLSVCCPLDTEQEPGRGRGRWEVRAECSLPTPLQPVACGHRPEALEGFPAGLPAGPQALAQGPRPEGGGKEAVHAEEGRCSGHADPWLQQSQRQGGPPGAGPPRMQPSVPGPLALLDATEGFAKRKKTSLWFVGSLLVVSVSILTVGLTATTRTENVTMGGYYPGIILGFGAFLGIIGINLVENRRQVLFAAIVFISFGVVAAFCCAIVDGVFAARHIEPRPLTAGRCQFFASEVGYVHDTYQTEVTCHSSNGQCQLKVRSSTCYCCDLYNCQSTEHPPAYYEFVGVHRCQDVLHLYRLLWASALLNVLGVLLGIVTAAVLGAFKDMVPLSQLAYGPSALPQILYNPAQQILAYTGFCPSPATLPTCSSYPLPLQVASVPTSSEVRAAVRAAHQKDRLRPTE
uniref:Transmembrane protein 255B n=1 Tax=Canis lupus familiaris TaxID=9615 RepID=A0A8C0S8V9_CANLF